MRQLVFIALLAFAAPAHAQTLADLSWLQGCWSMRDRDLHITEVWTAPPNAPLFGFSITTGAHNEDSWEQLRIEADEDGHIDYVAMPHGATPVRFRLRESEEANVAIFENPEHDYPQRIAYRRDSERLTATISAIDGARPFAFRYRRTACPRGFTP